MMNDFNIVVEGRDGKFIVNKNDVVVSRSLILYGEYARQEMKYFKTFCAPGDVIVEVGANIGAHTVGLARTVENQGQIIAIEPQPILFHNLCGNISINSLTNVQCLNLAISNVEGITHIPPINYSSENNFSAFFLDDAYTGQKISTKRLDDILRLSRFDFLKIDVEGMEMQVLEGTERHIKEFKPILFVENIFHEKSQALIEHLWGMDYELYWCITPYFSEDNFNQNKENVFSNNKSFDILGIHKSSDKDMPLTNLLPKVEDSEFHPLK
ncbi:MAG: FkbM family methyltransferase [Nitrospinaceae bacterium]|nr:FkbM family methyltransferase [Nitrospinaceae bacterium]MBT3435209.1 FkbM family methyltransferase [Nitrospinaceae bacterium]MBT3822582.1 FkbM family methyltransferase [Nitrospinaceae bacterium]MBT4093394.1 FkbM family methyltransferase [Nitrospinaceae bacterium]MBT4430569.1 FkbM family methyltransferase [Nitrospinaceae bacterium]